MHSEEKFDIKKNIYIKKMLKTKHKPVKRKIAVQTKKKKKNLKKKKVFIL